MKDFLKILILTSILATKGEVVEFEHLYNLQEKNELLEIEKSLQKNIEKETDTAKLFILYKKLGITYHNLSVIELKGYSQKAKEILQHAWELSGKSDYQTLAYLGSAWTLCARDAKNPIKKIAYVNRGCKIIDEAVKKAKYDIVIRLVRINNSLALPAFFKRRKYAEKDIEFLFSLYKEKPSLFSKEALASLFFAKAEVLKIQKNFEEAKKYWEKTIKLAPDSYIAKKAKERLKNFFE